VFFCQFSCIDPYRSLTWFDSDKIKIYQKIIRCYHTCILPKLKGKWKISHFGHQSRLPKFTSRDIPLCDKIRQSKIASDERIQKARMWWNQLCANMFGIPLRVCFEWVETFMTFHARIGNAGGTGNESDWTNAESNSPIHLRLRRWGQRIRVRVFELVLIGALHA
jgi:hypothetical protein